MISIVHPTLTLSYPNGQDRISGTIELTGSKSISNRALIIQALTKEPFTIERLAQANDTELMQELLSTDRIIRDAGPAGTTYRFMTAYLAMQPGTQVLTGTERMKKRPIGVLVEALRKLGAQIKYLEKEGFPPLEIGESNALDATNQLSIPASTSSQYISALLMIAPTLPNGLELTLEGKIVSRPYIEMTLALMKYFGVEHNWYGQKISVPTQAYKAKPFVAEADWSAASYYYAMAAMASEADLTLKGLFQNSVQGDAVLAEMMTHFGVTTTYLEDGIHLKKIAGQTGDPTFEWDFLRCPDLAQTLAVICASMGVKGRFTGLETLRIKETDRIAALHNELQKVHADFKEDLHNPIYFHTQGKARVGAELPRFKTYEDHRMAMAFAPLAMLGPIQIEEPMVVVKSYPDFWKDLESLGFEVDHKV